MAIADSVPAIFQNHGIRVRGGIGFSVNKGREKDDTDGAQHLLAAAAAEQVRTVRK